MTKFNAETAASICDFLCGCSIVTKACEAHNISNSTFWDWVAKSRRNPPELPPFTWMNMEANFYQHVQNAKRIFANGLLDAAMQRARYGSERRIYYQGEEKFAVRTDIPPDINDPDVLEMLYDQRDRFKRDANGHLVHLTEHIDPPVALSLAVLAANFEAYQPHSSQSIEVTQRGEMGVKVVGAPPKPEPVKLEHKPVEVIATPEPQEAEQLATELPTPESLSDDPPETIGGDTETPVDAPVRAPRPDIEQNVLVRAAKFKLHKGERANGAVEQQIMNALKLNFSPEQRERRLRELVGDYRDADDKQEGLGAGPSGPGGVRVV